MFLFAAAIAGQYSMNRGPKGGPFKELHQSNVPVFVVMQAVCE